MTRTNWRDEQSVINLCRRLGAGNCVVKYGSRPNYNIMRTSRASEVVDNEGVRMIFTCTKLNAIVLANDEPVKFLA